MRARAPLIACALALLSLNVHVAEPAIYAAPQDRRGEETYPGGPLTYVQEARRRAGENAPQRTGCHLAAGFGAVTLFWMRANGALPSSGWACFLMDYFVIHQPSGGATIAARLLPGDLPGLQRDVQRIARSVQITRKQ